MNYTLSVFQHTLQIAYRLTSWVIFRIIYVYITFIQGGDGDSDLLPTDPRPSVKNEGKTECWERRITTASFCRTRTQSSWSRWRSWGTMHRALSSSSATPSSTTRYVASSRLGLNVLASWYAHLRRKTQLEHLVLIFLAILSLKTWSIVWLHVLHLFASRLGLKTDTPRFRHLAIKLPSLPRAQWPKK